VLGPLGFLDPKSKEAKGGIEGGDRSPVMGWTPMMSHKLTGSIVGVDRVRFLDLSFWRKKKNTMREVPKLKPRKEMR
jgi:hypothetical protein